MKKKFIALICALCAALGIAAFAACGSGSAGSTEIKVNGEVKFEVSAVFTASSDVSELTEKTSVKDYLDALAEKGEITFDGEEGTYGYYITSVNGVTEHKSADGKSGYSWMIYTDFLKQGDITYADPEYGTYAYGEKVLASASYGVSSLPCVDGYTYALVYQSWSY